MLAISLLTLVPGEIGGSETYARGLTRGLAEVGTLPYTVFAPPVARDAGGGLPTVVVEEYGTATSLPGRAVAMARAALRPGRLRRAYAAARAVHYPLTSPLPSLDVPTAVTLLDVLHLDLPALVPRAERLVRKLTYDRASRRATLVIVPSAFSAERAVALLGLDPDRVRVAPNGIDHERFRPAANADATREPFLLYPARPWPHKNHARLLEAFAVLRRERPELRLVLTGGGHEGRAYGEGVELRGLVPPTELVSLLQRAAALVFPSRYEGWGAPPLEAMACGCPVAASRAGSLPEVCGDAAKLFDPDSPEEIAATVDELLRDPGPWIARGLERARAFTWAECARRHEQVYRELL